MADITDIIPQSKTVTISGIDIKVYGIGLDAITRALSIHPELSRLLLPAQRATGFNASSLLLQAPMAIYDLIAVAVGRPDDQPTIDAIRRLSFASQLDLVDAVIELSFPGGILPFVARLTGMLGDAAAPEARRLLNGGAGIVEPVTNGEPPSIS